MKIDPETEISKIIDGIQIKHSHTMNFIERLIFN